MTHYLGRNGQTYSPVELTSFIVQRLIDQANEKLMPQDGVTGAVICVPADFTQAQIAATEEAARDAGLERIELMHEPTAAALAYGYDARKVRRIAVFDLGGGTFDISVIQTGGGLVEVKANGGIRDCGGTDWDRRIVDYVVKMFATKYRRKDGSPIDLTTSDYVMTLIRVEAEEVKKRLTARQETRFLVQDVAKDDEGVDLSADFIITRSLFEELTADLRERVIGACQTAMENMRLKDPKFTVRDLNDVLLVGGMSRIPSIREDVAKFFGKPPNKMESPEHVVAMGAAIRAAVLEGRRKDLTILDISSHTLALEVAGDVASVIFPKGTEFPAEKTITLSNEVNDQKALSIRLIQGEGHRPEVCELLAAADLIIEPGPAESAREKMTVRLDASGRPSAECGEWVYGERAA